MVVALIANKVQAGNVPRKLEEIGYFRRQSDLTAMGVGPVEVVLRPVLRTENWIAARSETALRIFDVDSVGADSGGSTPFYYPDTVIAGLKRQVPIRFRNVNALSTQFNHGCVRVGGITPLVFGTDQ